MTTEQKEADVSLEDSVERAQWEPLHEWESRVKFVEDNVATHGLEKAIQLSIVWGNMKFLGCRYPERTEALVSHYPLPSLDDLREKRRHRPTKRARNEEHNDDIDGPSGPKQGKPAASRAEVSALISSIRSETDKMQQSSSSGDQPLVGPIKEIADTMCLCEKCLGKVDTPTSKAVRILERYASMCGNRFSFDFTFVESPDSHVCNIVVDGAIVLKKSGTKKKDAKSAVSAKFVKSIEAWQEANQLPPCANVRKEERAPPPSQHSYNEPYHPPYNGGPKGNHYMPPPRGRGNHGYRGGGYNRGGYY